MNKIASPQELQAELRRLLAYAASEKPSREKLATEMRVLADRVAAQTWTVLQKNELTGTTVGKGIFDSEEEAVASAEKEAKRARNFAVYEVWTGNPRNPGRPTKHEFRGVH